MAKRCRTTSGWRPETGALPVTDSSLRQGWPHSAPAVNAWVGEAVSSWSDLLGENLIGIYTGVPETEFAEHAYFDRSRSAVTNDGFEAITVTFKPAVWIPISIVLSVLNTAGAAMATWGAEPWHAGGHALLALAFAMWAIYLRQNAAGSQNDGRIESVEAEVLELGAHMHELGERLDFTERVLAQRGDAARLGDDH